MTAPYKKRAKKGWNCDRDQANRSERLYGNAEIKEQLRETDPTRRKAGKKSKKEKEILSLIRAIRFASKISLGDIESLKSPRNEGIHGTFRKDFYQKARKAYEKLFPLKEDTEIHPKIRKQIAEVLLLSGWDKK